MKKKEVTKLMQRAQLTMQIKNFLMEFRCVGESFNEARGQVQKVVNRFKSYRDICR